MGVFSVVVQVLFAESELGELVVIDVTEVELELVRVVVIGTVELVVCSFFVDRVFVISGFSSLQDGVVPI